MTRSNIFFFLVRSLVSSVTLSYSLQVISLLTPSYPHRGQQADLACEVLIHVYRAKISTRPKTDDTEDATLLERISISLAPAVASINPEETDASNPSVGLVSGRASATATASVTLNISMFNWPVLAENVTLGRGIFDLFQV